MIGSLLAALATCVVAAGPAVFHARAVDGREAVGSIAAWDADGVTLEVEGRRETFRFDQLSRLVAKRPAAPPIRRVAVWIALRDGSLLAARQYEVEQGTARLLLRKGRRVELPVDRVRWVRFGPPNPDVDAQWSEIVEADAPGDLIVVRRGEAIDFIEGILHDITPERVHFELDGDRLPVKREKLEGVVYAHAPGAGAEPGGRAGQPAGRAAADGGAGSVANKVAGAAVGNSDDAVAVVADAAGSRFVAARLAWQAGQQGGTLQCATPGGLEVQLALSEIVSIDFSQGKVVYLSDLDWLPNESRWTPYFELDPLPDSLRAYFAPRRDRGFDAPRLHVGGRAYARGLSLQSRTELVYRLPEGFRRFEAIVGIDDAHGESGHVQLLIEGDGQLLYSAEIRGGEAPVPLKLNIDGVRRLRIVVDFAGDLDVADCLDLCEARLLK